MLNGGFFIKWWGNDKAEGVHYGEVFHKFIEVILLKKFKPAPRQIAAAPSRFAYSCPRHELFEYHRITSTLSQLLASMHIGCADRYSSSSPTLQLST